MIWGVPVSVLVLSRMLNNRGSYDINAASSRTVEDLTSWFCNEQEAMTKGGILHAVIGTTLIYKGIIVVRVAMGLYHPLNKDYS